MSVSECNVIGHRSRFPFLSQMSVPSAEEQKRRDKKLVAAGGTLCPRIDFYLLFIPLVVLALDYVCQSCGTKLVFSGTTYIDHSGVKRRSFGTFGQIWLWTQFVHILLSVPLLWCTSGFSNSRLGRGGTSCLLYLVVVGVTYFQWQVGLPSVFTFVRSSFVADRLNSGDYSNLRLRFPRQDRSEFVYSLTDCHTEHVWLIGNPVPGCELPGNLTDTLPYHITGVDLESMAEFQRKAVDHDERGAEVTNAWCQGGGLSFEVRRHAVAYGRPYSWGRQLGWIDFDLLGRRIGAFIKADVRRAKACKSQAMAIGRGRGGLASLSESLAGLDGCARYARDSALWARSMQCQMTKVLEAMNSYRKAG